MARQPALKKRIMGPGPGASGPATARRLQSGSHGTWRNRMHTRAAAMRRLPAPKSLSYARTWRIRPQQTAPAKTRNYPCVGAPSGLDSAGTPFSDTEPHAGDVGAAASFHARLFR